MRSLAGVVLAATILAAGCAPSAAPGTPGLPSSSAPTAALANHVVPAGATGSVDPVTWALADRLAAPAYTTDTTAAIVAALARSGIGTYADPSSPAPETPLTGPASPFRLLDFQAHALAVGAWADSGLSGADLDTVVPLPDGQAGLPTTSDLLAAYVGSADSPGGALSRALLAGQDLLQPATVQFPAVVLVLFASDLATDGGRLAPPTPGPSASGTGAAALVELAVAHPDHMVAIAPADAGGVCSTVSNWADNVIHTLFNALKLATPDNVPGAIITGIWNWLVSAGEALVRGLISSVTNFVLGQIRSVAAMISGVAEQIASILPYVVSVIPLGPTGSASIDLGPDPQRGSFNAVISAGDLPDWPGILKDCAKTLDVALPEFNPSNVPITWGPLQPATDALLGPIDTDRTKDVTDADGRATWGFVVSRDPGDPKGSVLYQIDRISVAAHRTELDTARQRLTTALFGWVPDLLRPFVSGLFDPFLDGLQDRVNKLLDAHGTGAVSLKYHAQASPAPSASISPAPSGSCTISLPAGTYTGTIETDITTIVPPGEIDLGEHGGENDHGTGPVTLVVASDGTLSGTFSQTLAMHFEADGLSKGTTDTTMIETGAGISGTLCTLTMALASETVTACKSTGYGTCGTTGQTFSLTGLVPPIPMGPPKSVAGGTLTWSLSAEGGADAGFGGLSAETQSTITVTIQGR